MIAAEQLLPLRHHTTIASHIPGRLRLKFSPGVFLHLSKIDFSDCQLFLDDFPAVKHYRLNLAAMSVVLEYDHHIVPFGLICQLFQPNDKQALQALDEIQSLLDLVP